MGGAGYLAGILSGLLAAVVWGGGDYSGGVAMRRGGALQVLVLSTASGAGLLLLLVLVAREGLPGAQSVRWAALAGLSTALGISALYRGLALGQAAAVAPTAAVVSAALPVLFSALTGGLPSPLRLVGFGLALLGIWLVSRAGDGGGAPRAGLGLALIAGCGFGSFYILIGRVEQGAIFAPLLIARCVALVLAAGLLLTRGQRLPGPRGQRVALLAGALDAGGNVFYLIAKQLTSLDVAAVLASLYPVTTVVLARALSREVVSRTQWLGAALCIVAVALITGARG